MQLRHMLLWGGFLMTFPFYLFQKGSVQLSTVLGMMLLGTLVYDALRQGAFRLAPGANMLVIALTGFVVYCAMVSGFWAMMLSDQKMLMTPTYYLFDLFLLIALLRLYTIYGWAFFRFTQFVVFATIILQFFLSFFFAKLGFRERLFFQNANALGYFSLVCASIMALPTPHSESPRVRAMFFAGILMCVWLAILSLSKAATLSTAMFLLLSARRSPSTLIVGGLVALIISAFNFNVVTHRIENLTTRYVSLGDDGGDDSLEGRGYDRIWENPEMLVLGAGEGGNYRWKSFSRRGEIHSSLGTIVFSYGIPGILLAGLFFASVLKPGGFSLLPYALPELAFSLTHMSLRFPLTWLYFVCLFMVGNELRKMKVSNAGKMYGPLPKEQLAAIYGRQI